MNNINSLLVTSLKINAGVIENSLGSLVVKTHGEGRGKREKGRYKRMSFYIDLHYFPDVTSER